MRRRGYYAMGLNEVVSRSHAPKGSLYHYFPGGKEELAGEAILSGGEVVTRRIEEAFARSNDLPETLRYFARLLARNLAESEFRDGCPVATTTLDAASESAAIQFSCARSFEMWRDVIASHLVATGAPEQEAADTAVLLLSSFEGALIMARAFRDVQPLFTVADTLARAIQS
jgi:TetR/AcrR family transcriptional repressor of lmrAB and yxaGH operons